MEANERVTADGVPVILKVHVFAVRVEPIACYACYGNGSTGTGYFDDDIKTCELCRGRGTRTDINVDTSEMESALVEHLDEFIRSKR